VPGKVLIADRSPKVQKELAQLLQEAGIDSVSVNNGEFAVRSLAKEKPHLVLADVFMLVRNGYEVCAHIKGDSETAHIPVLLLVGSAEPYDKERALMVGAAGKLEKPFTDPPAVLQTIKQHIGTVLPQAVRAPAAEAAPAPPPAATAASTTTEAAPAELAVDEEPVTEQELFFMGPEPAQMEPQESPLGFAELLGDEITAAVATAASRAAAPAAGEVDIRSFFLKQKETIRGRTSEVIARIKPEHMGWRPEKAALTVGEMLRHIWLSEQGLRRTALKGDFSYYEKRLPQGLRAVLGQPASLEEELKNLDTVHKQTLAQVKAFPVERWQEERAHPGLGIRLKVYAFLLGINEHEIHHRAQLMLYLRLLGSPLPEPTVRRAK
jgi:CheY-like chemotaxis protein/uncharacterized damage-inducible protein DinB